MNTYGYYSEQQFENLKNSEREYPYIYYKNIDNIIVQVTEVTTNPEYQSKFNDAVHLGKLKNSILFLQILLTYNLKIEPNLNSIILI